MNFFDFTPQFDAPYYIMYHIITIIRVAQRLADQCKFAHDCPDCRRVARFKVRTIPFQF